MLELASSLTAHQQGLRRVPALEVLVSPERFDIPALRFAPDFEAAETEYPHDATFAPDGTFVQVANRNGNLDVRLDFGSWTTIDTNPAPGEPVAIAATTTEITIITGEGNSLVRYHSTDNGLSWSSPATIVTEASPITAVALGARASNGNLCAFYVLNSTSTVKRLRRSSGTWAGSGTTWTKSADWNAINGIAAIWQVGAFVLLITGEQATTLKPTVAAYAMGDGALPTNVWSGPELVLQADPASTITYAAPHLESIEDLPFGTFTATQTADVAFSGRIFLTHGTDATGIQGWREPAPLPFSGTHGASLSYSDTIGAYAATLSRSDASPVEDDVDLSAALTSCSWRQTPTSCKARLSFALPEGTTEPLLAPGNGIRIRHGYRSGTDGAAQYGLALTLAIDRVTATVAGGRQTITVDAIGPWETLDDWRSPQAWTAPSGTTRGTIFQYIAGRAGLTLTLLTGEWAPSDAWTNEQPAFAIAAGESGGSVLRRLLEPTGDFVRATGGRFDALSFAPDQSTVYDYGTGLHAVGEVSTITAAAPNWFRIQGPDRYADAFDEHEANTVGPRFLTLRQLSSNTDELAEEAAAAALRRVRVLTPRAKIAIPANVGAELFDPVTITSEPLGLETAAYRVIEIEFTFRRAPHPNATMTQTLTLGDL